MIRRKSAGVALALLLLATAMVPIFADDGSPGANCSTMAKTDEPCPTKEVVGSPVCANGTYDVNISKQYCTDPTYTVTAIHAGPFKCIT